MKISQLKESSNGIDDSVIVDRDVFPNRHLPETFNVDYIKHFSCEYCELTSLENFPKMIKNSLFIGNNKLTDLKNCPTQVGDMFYAENNPLTSLEGIPRKVGKDINISIAHLKTIGNLGYVPSASALHLRISEFHVLNNIHVNLVPFITWDVDKILFINDNDKASSEINIMFDQVKKSSMSDRAKVMKLTQLLIDAGYENLTKDSI